MKKTEKEIYIDSSGTKVTREFVNESDALNFLDKLASRSEKFDLDFYEIKPDWYLNKDGTKRIEFSLT